jgi:hypothetical protein
VTLIETPLEFVPAAPVEEQPVDEAAIFRSLIEVVLLALRGYDEVIELQGIDWDLVLLDIYIYM